MSAAFAIQHHCVYECHGQDHSFLLPLHFSPAANNPSGTCQNKKGDNLQSLYLETEVANPPALLQICARVGADPGLGECLGEFLVHIFHLSSLDLHFPASWGWENTSELRLSARKGSAHQRHVYTGEN